MTTTITGHTDDIDSIDNPVNRDITCDTNHIINTAGNIETNEFSSLLNGNDFMDCEGEETAKFFTDGSYYIGEWLSSSNLPHGPGILTFANGDRYEGNFNQGMFNGSGLFVRASQNKIKRKRSSVSSTSSAIVVNQKSCPCDILRIFNTQNHRGTRRSIQISESPQSRWSRCREGDVESSPSPQPSPIGGRQVIRPSKQRKTIIKLPRNLQPSSLHIDKCVYTYAGEWKNGQQNGKGAQIWMNGYKFVGNFESGHPVGQGKLFITQDPTLQDDHSYNEAGNAHKESFVLGQWIPTELVFETPTQDFKFNPGDLVVRTQSADSKCLGSRSGKCMLVLILVLLLIFAIAGVCLWKL